MTLEQMELRAIEKMAKMTPAEQRAAMMQVIRGSEAEQKIRDLKKGVAESDAAKSRAMALAATIEPKYTAEVQKIQAAAEKATAEAMRLQAEAEKAPEVAMRGMNEAMAQAQEAITTIEASAAPARAQLEAYTAFMQAYDAGDQEAALMAFAPLERELKAGNDWSLLLKNKLLRGMLHGEAA